MKKIWIICLGIMAAIQSDAQFTKANLQASGLTCAMCSNAVNKALQKLPFVASVKSDIKNSSFNITFKEKAEMDIDGLKNAVEDAGFSVAKLKLTGNFKDVKIVNDENAIINGWTFHFVNVKNQVLDGEKTITLVEKGFLTEKEFKKISSVVTGLNASKKDINHSTIYHVTI